jgi:hypothetical protein
MVMVEDPANDAACSLGDLAGSLDGSNADILAGDRCTLADVAGGVDWVERDQIARTFSDTLGRCSGAFGGPFANVSGAAADVTAGAAFLGLGMRVGLGLSVLAKGVRAAEGKGEGENRDGWYAE